MRSDFNIIIVNDFSYITGGADNVAISSAIALAKAGYNVILFSAVKDNLNIQKYGNLTLICIDQYDILNDPNRIRSIIQGMWNRKAAIEMDKLLSTFDKKNTIIQVHSWTKALSSSVVKKAIDRDFKIVLTLHDYFTVCPNGGFFNYNKNEICKLNPLSMKCICDNCDSRLYLHKVWRIARQIIQNKFGYTPSQIKNFIIVSKFSRDILEPYLPKNAKFYHVNNPIEIRKEEPIRVDKNENFIAIGRLNKEKGVDIFAKAANELKCKAMFIGDGPCKEEILKCYKNSEITGWLNKENVVDYLKKARALIFPSQIYETQGLPVLEAAAMGVPAIVSDTCAARDLVVDGVTGLLFKRNDYKDLAKKIRILQNPYIAKEMGETAYEKFWCDKYTMNDHIERLIKVYNKILLNN